MKRRLSNQGRVILAVLAISCGAITEVRAGTITAAELVRGCGSFRSLTTVTELSKEFDKICTMEIVFTVMNTGRLGEAMFAEVVTNRTGMDWIDFHMQLGFGLGDGFRPVGANCGVAFATSPVPRSTVFRPIGVSSDTIDWGGGTLQHQFLNVFNFTVNVQDLASGNPCLPLGSERQNGYTFTLRQTPTIVPEPATMLLLGTGLAGVAIKMRKRLKSRNSAG